MRVLNSQEVEVIGGGLTDIQNTGLGLGIGAFFLTVAAVVFAPVTVVSGGLWILAAGAAALSTAAFAVPTPPEKTGTVTVGPVTEVSSGSGSSSSSSSGSDSGAGQEEDE
ncbi:MAG: hypothetical protein V4582_11695 [Pseudomonadota bacterium]